MTHVLSLADKSKPLSLASLAKGCLLWTVLGVTNCSALAECLSSLPLNGVITIKTCDANKEACVSGEKAVYDYMQKVKDKPGAYTVALNASPWRFYDAEMRIVTVQEMAQTLKSSLTKEKKRIELIASWTGVAPDDNSKSLAQQLSDQLNGFPVSGMDGFLWITKDGTLRTTHQAFSAHTAAAPYKIAEGDEIFVPLVAGWPAEMESAFLKDQNAEGIMRAGAGWDIFFLCPDRALQAFEAAAKLGHPIAAYNAALIRLERGSKNDLTIAKALLVQAANIGGNKAKTRLQMLKKGLK